jgi:hypothetical protein
VRTLELDGGSQFQALGQQGPCSLRLVPSEGAGQGGEALGDGRRPAAAAGQVEGFAGQWSRGVGVAGHRVSQCGTRKLVDDEVFGPPRPGELHRVFLVCRRLVPRPDRDGLNGAARRHEHVDVGGAAYRSWCDDIAELLAERERWIDQHLSRGQDLGVDRSDGLEL